MQQQAAAALPWTWPKGSSRARGFIKRELAQRLGLRYMPDMKFFYDDAIDRGARIEELIKMVKEE
jgi:ribosome-binding factor A